MKILKMFKDKKGRFVDAFRAFTVGNVFFGLVMLIIATFVISYFIKSIFGIGKVIAIGRPLQIIIVGGALVITFYVVIKRQGALDRSDVFVLIFLLTILGTTFYYMPKLLPDIFNPITQSLTNIPIVNPIITEGSKVVYNASVTIHDSIQSVIPIP